VTELISLAAPAKINLSLRILGKRPDGFHEVETLMVPLALADEVEVDARQWDGSFVLPAMIPSFQQIRKISA
jgi:4-diphosphocytidyl-2C-methyl-D-erythritol kinase